MGGRSIYLPPTKLFFKSLKISLKFYRLVCWYIFENDVIMHKLTFSTILCVNFDSYRKDLIFSLLRGPLILTANCPAPAPEVSTKNLLSKVWISPSWTPGP